jgi:hypothetical protein
MAEAWTIGRLLSWTADYLASHGSDSPRLEAEVLLAHARGCKRIELYTSFEDPAADDLRAKTGTLSHAYALSGYVTDARGEHLAFSLMLNHYQRPTDALGRNIQPSPTADLDTIAAMLAGR